MARRGEQRPQTTECQSASTEQTSRRSMGGTVTWSRLRPSQRCPRLLGRPQHVASAPTSHAVMLSPFRRGTSEQLSVFQSPDLPRGLCWTCWKREASSTDQVDAPLVRLPFILDCPSPAPSASTSNSPAKSAILKSFRGTIRVEG